MIKYTESQLEKLKKWIISLIDLAMVNDGRVFTKAENGASKIWSVDQEFSQLIYDAVNKATDTMYSSVMRVYPHKDFANDVKKIFFKVVDYSLGYYNTVENMKLLTVHSKKIIELAENQMPLAFKKATETNPLFSKVNYDKEKAFNYKARSIYRLYGETAQGYKLLIELIKESFGDVFRDMILSIQLKDFNKR